MFTSYELDLLTVRCERLQGLCFDLSCGQLAASPTPDGLETGMQQRKQNRTDERVGFVPYDLSANLVFWWEIM